ncbi:MAG: diadenylate cyclase CdaA [Clostridia bacterium]|nr:diadenylate cyclase CdaA [Clostridia bacterium]
MFDYLGKFIQLIKVTDIIDIVIVAVLIYQILKMIRETRTMQLVKGIAILLVVLQISTWLNFTVINYILRNIMQVGLFMVVVIFQPELRSILEKVGHSKVGKLIDFSAIQMNDEKIEKVIGELVSATVNLSQTKTGALIVLERETKLGDVGDTGAILNAEITAALLENIFVPNTPLHDGAVIIRDDRIYSAGCVLPLTSNKNLSRELGTRHRAAIGVSEVSDCVVLVVSEETGKISIAINGTLTRNLNENTLKNAIERALLKPAKNSSKLDKIKLRRRNKNER